VTYYTQIFFIWAQNGLLHFELMVFSSVCFLTEQHEALLGHFDVMRQMNYIRLVALCKRMPKLDKIMKFPVH